MEKIHCFPPLPYGVSHHSQDIFASGFHWVTPVRSGTIERGRGTDVLILCFKVIGKNSVFILKYLASTSGQN